MAFLLVVALVVVLHLVVGLGAWQAVGLLADDHHMVGGAVLRHRGDWTLSGSFLPNPVPDAPVALFRPFIDLAFWLEQPWFGIEAFGYHVTNSALHCTTAVVWYLLVRRWSGSVPAAVAAALLFTTWAGHSEATHWIAARTNVMSTCVLSLALLAHDVGLGHRGTRRAIGLWFGALLAAVAIGTKESAVFVVPVAAMVAWHRVGDATMGLLARAWAAARASLPMAIAAISWLAWRAHCLGTWGSGTNYGWKAQRVSFASCLDWFWVLIAPAHHAYVPMWAKGALVFGHGALLVLAIAALRSAAVRRAAAPAAVLLALGYVAGAGLEALDLHSLENVRYTYEPALGLCVCYGLAIAGLPRRVLWPTLGVLVALHAYVLDANRQSWLRVADVYAHMKAQVLEQARSTQQPVRVLDGPGVHDGAFGYLNGYTEFLFWQQTAPPGTNLRGSLSSTMEWPAVLFELAALAPQRQLPNPISVVRWTDGALVPFVLATTFPTEPWPGVSLRYARIARERPFVGDDLPVHVLVQTAMPLELRAVAAGGGAKWEGEVVHLPAGEAAVPVPLSLPLPMSLAPDVAVAITLRLSQAGRDVVVPLGDVLPASR